jgi:hypothetical protein
MNRFDYRFWLLLRLPKVNRAIVIKRVGTLKNNVIDGCHAADMFVELIF